MAGLIGFIGKDDDALLARMGRALESDGRFRTELYHNGEVGLGRVSLGILNPERQPVWNEDRSVCLVMEGELFDYPPGRQRLSEQARRLQTDSDAEFLLQLYETCGEAFVRELNGAFVVAIWDSRRRKLLVATDRLGLYPVYYVWRNGYLSFASGVRGLMADPDLPRRVDRVAIGQFLTFDHLLGERTLLQDVKRLLQGSLLIHEDGQLRTEQYWEPRPAGNYDLRSEEEWMECLEYYLQRAVRRQAPVERPAGLLLSGGLDSRLILAYLGQLERDAPFFTFTWGIPNCDDARYAREVAAAVGVEHRFFQLKPDWLLNHAEACVRETDGMANIVNLHARATLKQAAEYAPVLYKGFLGDAMMGYGLRHEHWAAYKSATRLRAHMEAHRQQGVITFDVSEWRQLFTKEFLGEVRGGIRESYRAAMDASGSDRLAEQRLYFDYTQRVPRHTLNGVRVARSRTAVRLPFSDKDLVNFMLQVPPGLLYQRRLVRKMFVRAFPELTKIPTADTNLPMRRCARDVMLRARRWARWHLDDLGLGSILPAGRRHYKDYDNWFRTELWDWANHILLDRRSLQRGYFEEPYVRRLLEEHAAGEQHAVKIGALLSLEIWHRQFID